MSDRKAVDALSVRGVNKAFGSNQVLRDVHLEAREGEVLGLVGVNGAGKSTLMNIIVGELELDSGDIFLGDEKLEVSSPRDAEERGISLIHQEPVDFGYMTVAENIYIANLTRFGRYIRKKSMQEDSVRYLKQLGSTLSPRARMNDLSMGQRQLVAVARALSQNSRVILFDEPTSSLSVNEKRHLFDLMQTLKSQGAIVIFITHFLDEVVDVCDRVCVLRDGRVAASGPTSEFTLKDIASEMLGREAAAFERLATGQAGHPVLSIKSLNQGAKLVDIEFSMNEGEVLGLWGLMGSGRTELVRAVLGLDPVSSGTVFTHGPDGETVEISSASLLQRVGYLTETRHDDGLFLQKPVWWNITSASLQSFLKRPFARLDVAVEKEQSLERARQLNVDMPGIDARVSELSGGNQQKTVVAKWLQRKPSIYFLDEPTRGVDVGAKSEIHGFIRRLASEGASVLLISSEIEEIVNLSDRVLVLQKGRIVRELGHADIEKEMLMELSVGASE